jgi:hypothetical protein
MLLFFNYIAKYTNCITILKMCKLQFGNYTKLGYIYVIEFSIYRYYIN